MRFNIFGYIREKVAEAVTGGFVDGIAAVSDPDAPAAPDLAALRERVAASVAPKSLPAAAPPADEKPARKK